MRKIDQFRPWQIEAFQLGRNATRFLIQCPGGAGKSLLLVMLAQDDIERNGNKQLLLVPKTLIHYGFTDEDGIEFKLPGNDHVSRWTVMDNFCSSKLRDSKIRELILWLVADPRDLAEQNRLGAIATHKALVEAWKRMTEDQKRQAVRQLSLRIDEGHHLSHVLHKSELIEMPQQQQKSLLEVATRLGALLQEVLDRDDKTTHLSLATATFFRGDRRMILSETLRREFEAFCLPWDEHFATLGIDHLSFDFIYYKDDPITAILELIQQEPSEKHLVILPSTSRRFRNATTLGKLLNALKSIVPEDRILDLVTRDTQEENKVLLFSEPTRFDVVIACRLFDEGTDWVPCSRMHNTDAGEQSLTLAAQRIFRPLRKHPGKKTVRIYNYLPSLKAEMTDDEKRELLSDRLNAQLVIIITQGELLPNVVHHKWESKGEVSKPPSLREVLGDGYASILKRMITEYEAIEDKSDSKSIELIVDGILDNLELPETVTEDDMRNALLNQLIRIANPTGLSLDGKKLLPEGVDSSSIREKGFDIVWKNVSPNPSLIVFGSENVDAATLRRLLSLSTNMPTLEDIQAAIRAYHMRTGRRPTFHQPDRFTELDRSASAVDKLLRRHHKSTLAEEVKKTLGGNAELLERTRALIMEYWRRGIRIGNKYGDLPEIGMTSYALNGRLIWNHGTTLAQEVEKLLGSVWSDLDLSKVRTVIEQYLAKGVRLSRKYGRIEELDITSFALCDRLKRVHNLTLSQLVKEVISSQDHVVRSSAS